jgi:endonuclease/exonuclease/phosphatase family metal-dependent hydrolase
MPFRAPAALIQTLEENSPPISVQVYLHYSDLYGKVATTVAAFRKPTFAYDYDVDAELRALRGYPKQPGKEDRAIPAKRKDQLLLATWNIANLGVQERREKDYRLLAEVLGWFDLVAIQEANDDLEGLRGIQAQLPKRYRVLFSDPGGNNERFVFLYDAEKVEVLEEIGKVTVPPKDLPSVKVPGITQEFKGFDRNPYLVSFSAETLTFVLANVHLYFGKEREKAGMDRRCLEAGAVGRWADLRRRNAEAYTRNVLALGDFNLPARDESDAVYRALTRKGLQLPPHSTKVGGSNLNDDAQYDQMAVFPGPMADAIAAMGVFDFDGAVFRDLWGETKAQQTKFRAYVRYYLSDHRPLWAALKTTALSPR